MYELWTVTILVASASLLRAIRLQRKRDWGIYAASLTLGLYTFPFTILVAIAHGIYVASTEVSQFFQSREGNSQGGIKISKTLLIFIRGNYLLFANY